MAREVVVLLSHFFRGELDELGPSLFTVMSAPLNWFELPVAAGAVARSLDPTGGHQGAPWAGPVPLQALQPPHRLKAQAHAVMAKNGILPVKTDMWGESGSAQLDSLTYPKPSTNGIAVPRPHDEEVDRDVISPQAVELVGWRDATQPPSLASSTPSQNRGHQPNVFAIADPTEDIALGNCA